MAKVLDGVQHIVEPWAEIMYSAGRQAGNVDARFDDPVVAALNKSLLLANTLKPAAYVYQKVQMGSKILDLSGIPDPKLDSPYKVDGLIIDRQGVALGLNPSDCFGVTMYDRRDGQAIGLFHAGRAGTQAGVHLNGMYKLIDTHDIAGEDLCIHLSPGIHADSYVFTPDIPEDMKPDMDGWRPFVEERSEGRFHIDVLGRILHELKYEGIRDDQIVLDYCDDVGANKNYFSHSRAARTGESRGRNMVAVMLRAD